MAIEEITIDELAARCDAGGVVLDVRNLDEYVEVRVPGVVLIPLPELQARHGEIPDVEVVNVICRSGARSARAVELLVANGIDAVNVIGGMLAWIDSGRPVDSGPPGS